MKNIKLVLCLLILMFCLLGCQTNDEVIIKKIDKQEAILNSLEENSDNKVNFKKVKVSRVVDGDTFIYKENDIEERVRLIGVDTPESVGAYKDSPEIYGIEASNFAKDILEDKEVFLSYDVSDNDKYNRVLAYVWLEMPKDQDDIIEIESKMFNAILLKEGYAKTMTIPPDVKYSEIFVILQKEAREKERGLWRE